MSCTWLELFQFLILRPCLAYYVASFIPSSSCLPSPSSFPLYFWYSALFPGSICSQNGNCGYFDPSGNSLPACSILDVTCSALCTCYSGYGGKDCSLSSASLTARNNLRYLLHYISCTTLHRAASTLTFDSGVVPNCTCSHFRSLLFQICTMSSLSHCNINPGQNTVSSHNADNFIAAIILTLGGYLR